MSEKQYMDADYEVISMVNRKRGPGGQLPSRVVHFIAEDDAPRILEIDRRIQNLREHSFLIVMAFVGLAFLLGLSV